MRQLLHCLRVCGYRSGSVRRSYQRVEAPAKERTRGGFEMLSPKKVKWKNSARRMRLATGAIK